MRLDGVPVTPERLLERASIVLQNADHQLYMRTALEEVATCLRLAAGKAGDRQEDPQRAALGILDMFALRPLADRHPQSLSGGEKQRLVIACALAKKPDVLILDEPTSGLDGSNMRRIADALAAMADRGACVLVITHDLELMEVSCTTALRLPL
jgi:energy-coupling factor transport system ATP-binding protein